jgi:hypothetical protein
MQIDICPVPEWCGETGQMIYDRLKIYQSGNTEAARSEKETDELAKIEDKPSEARFFLHLLKEYDREIRWHMIVGNDRPEVLEKMLLKSVVGYSIAAVVSYGCWIGISKFINEKFDEITGESKIKFWRNSVWVTSAFLWATWLMHDVANIAVYLPRKLDLSLLVIVLVYLTILLFYIFYIHGGPIQKIVLDKTGTRYARSATIINIIYAGILYYFKELNTLPMSTTFCFIGLLCGRELAISTMNKDYKLKYVFPIIGKDFIKLSFGLGVSIGIVMAIHFLIIPNGAY